MTENGPDSARRLWVRILTITASLLSGAVLVLGGMVWSGRDKSVDSQFVEQASELARLRTEQASLRNDVARLHSEVVDLRIAFARMESSAERGNQEIRAANQKMDQLIGVLNTLRRQAR